jgi:hypothetical protein
MLHTDHIVLHELIVTITNTATVRSFEIVGLYVSNVTISGVVVVDIMLRNGTEH